MTVLRLASDADIAIAVRGAAGESVVVLIEPGRDPLALALALGAIAPLAAERAPRMRVNAVMSAKGADPADVDAAIAFLERAVSTTGQLIEISPR